MGRCEELSDQVWRFSLAGLAILAILTRIPSVSSVPLNSDAVQYVLALDRFDLSSHQPHPPGNPLYVLLGRMVNSIVGDPHFSLVLISLISGVGAVVLSGILGAALYDRRLGLIVGALMLVNPWLWNYSTAALPYSLETVSVIAIALLVWQVVQRPGATPALVLGVAVAVAGGFRPSVLPFVALLFLLGLASLSWRDRLIAVCVTTAGCLIWLIPLLLLSGGPAAYLEETRALSDVTTRETSLFTSGLGSYWLQNLQSLTATFLLLTLPLIGFVLFSLIKSRPQLSVDRFRDPRLLLLWGWVAPAIAFFVVVHFGQPGYLLFLAPPIIILMAAQMRQSFWSGSLEWTQFATRVAPILALGVVLSVLSLVTQRELDDRWEGVEVFFSEQVPEDSVLFVASSYRIAGYLLPETRVVGIGVDNERDAVVWGPQHVALSGVQEFSLVAPSQICSQVSVGRPTVMVLYDRELTTRLVPGSDESWMLHRLSTGEELWYREFAPDEALSFEQDGEALEIRAIETMMESAPDSPHSCSLEMSLAPL